MQAYLNMQNAKSFEIEATGKIDPNMPIIPKQDLKSVKIKDGKTFYNYTVSKGMVSTFYEIYGTHETSTLKRGTKVKKDLTPETVNETQELSLETFKETYGLMPYELNYLVNSQTVIGIKNSIKENNTHIFTLVLDNELSTQSYKKNIVATNTAKSKPPVFDKIELTVYINQDGYFEKIIYHETYHIEIELPILGFRTQKITTQITEEFKIFNQAVSINPFDI